MGPAAAAADGWRTRFLLLTLIWGASFLFIKLGVAAFAPLQVALGRVVFGTAALLAVLRARREPLPREPVVWAHLAVAALLLNVVPFTLFAAAEQSISSALAGICNATTPLFTLLVAILVLPDERPNARRCLGLAIGFAGVVVVLGAWRGLGGGQDATAALLALAASACYGLGWAYVRRNLSGRRHSSLALSAGQLVAGTLELAVVAPLATTVPTHVPASAVLAIVALGALGTGLAYVLQYGLIRDVGATVATTVTYFIPIVSVLIGVAVLGEQLSWNAPAGAAVIIAGALISRAPAVRRQRSRMTSDRTRAERSEADRACPCGTSDRTRAERSEADRACPCGTSDRTRAERSEADRACPCGTSSSG
jgi:drug/metabolite transporter (DMT)-like permease